VILVCHICEEFLDIVAYRHLFCIPTNIVLYVCSYLSETQKQTHYVLMSTLDGIVEGGVTVLILTVELYAGFDECPNCI
jgi:hypothetical protein